MQYSTHVVKCKDLQIDRKYQRMANPKWVNYIVTHWDPRQVRPLTISVREDGSKWIVDGQHTSIAALEVLGDKATLPARLYFRLSLKQEADLFHELNTNTKAVSANDRMKALYAAGDERITEYVNALNESGAPWAFSTGGGKSYVYVGHTGGLKLFERYGPVFTEAVRCVFLSGEKSFLYTRLIGGVCYLLKNTALKSNDIENTLRKITKDDFEKRIRFYGGAVSHDTVNTTDRLYARVLLDFYNKGKRRKVYLNEEVPV